MHSGHKWYKHVSNKTPIVDYSASQNPYLSAVIGLAYSIPQENYMVRLKVINTDTGESSEKTIGMQKRNILINTFDISDLLFFIDHTHAKAFFNVLRGTNTQPTVAPLNSKTLDPKMPINACFEIYFLLKKH